MVVNLPPSAEAQSFELEELAQTGTIVGRVNVSDPENDPLIFTIVAGNENEIFSINSSGQILVVKQGELLISNIAEYTLTVEIFDGFNITKVIITIILVEEKALGLDSEFVFGIYPVPAKTELNVILKRPSEVYAIQLFDLSGRSVLRVNSNFNSKIAIDLRSLMPGVYVLTLDTSKGVERFRFIKN